MPENPPTPDATGDITAVVVEWLLDEVARRAPGPRTTSIATLLILTLVQAARRGVLGTMVVWGVGDAMKRWAPGWPSPILRRLEVLEQARDGDIAGFRTLQQAAMFAEGLLALAQEAEVTAAVAEVDEQVVELETVPVVSLSASAGVRIELGSRTKMARYLASLKTKRELAPAMDRLSARLADVTSGGRIAELVGASRALEPIVETMSARLGELAGVNRAFAPVTQDISARFAELSGVNRVAEQIGMAATEHLRESLSARLGVDRFAELARPAFADVAARMPAALDSSRFAELAGVRTAMPKVEMSLFAEMERTRKVFEPAWRAHSDRMRRALKPVMRTYIDSTRTALAQANLGIGRETLRTAQRFNNDIADP